MHMSVEFYVVRTCEFNFTSSSWLSDLILIRVTQYGRVVLFCILSRSKAGFAFICVQSRSMAGFVFICIQSRNRAGFSLSPSADSYTIDCPSGWKAVCDVIKFADWERAAEVVTTLFQRKVASKGACDIISSKQLASEEVCVALYVTRSKQVRKGSRIGVERCLFQQHLTQIIHVFDIRFGRYDGFVSKETCFHSRWHWFFHRFESLLWKWWQILDRGRVKRAWYQVKNMTVNLHMGSDERAWQQVVKIRSLPGFTIYSMLYIFALILLYSW